MYVIVIRTKATNIFDASHWDSFVIYVVTSPTTAFAVSWFPGSIINYMCLLGFLHISNDVCSPYSTPQLAWYFDFAMTTCLTPSRYCTGIVCQNGSTLNWRSWHTDCWTVWRHRIWINSFRYQACQVVAVCCCRSRCSCTSHSTVCQQPAVGRFLSQPPFSGTLYQTTCSLFLPATAKDILVSPVISGHYSLNFRMDFATV